MFYIYLTTNLINGKKYIGQHKGSPNDSYLGSGTTILKAIAKYGKENFKKEILCFCDSREEADQKEKEFISLYDAVNSRDFYNNAEGGTGGDGWKAAQRWMKANPEKAKKLYAENSKKLIEWAKNNPEKAKHNTVKRVCHDVPRIVYVLKPSFNSKLILFADGKFSLPFYVIY